MVGINNAGFEPAPSSTPTNSTAQNTQKIFLQLRPGTQQFRKCFDHLAAVVNTHSNVEIDLVGYARDAHQFRLTLAVDLGPREEIAIPGATAIGGFSFISDAFARLSDFLPQYTDAPTGEESDAAKDLMNVMSETDNSLGFAI
jgi:hypothetical protein